ncbi:M48 family metalloprotease [Streptomyces sodiiphilus]
MSPAPQAPPAYPGTAGPGLPATGQAAPPAYPGTGGSPVPEPPGPQPHDPHPGPQAPAQPSPPSPPRQFDPSRDLLLHDRDRDYIAARQRGADATAIGQLGLVLLPGLLCSLFVLVPLTAVFFRDAWWVPVVLWLAVPVLLVFHRPTERWFARRILGLRVPDRDEMAYLAPIWREVTKRAAVDQANYELWIEKGDGLNAYAAAGHIVAVTEYSMRQLPPGQLAGILAHELGHHIGGHTWIGLMTTWYMQPARITYAVMRAILRGIARVVIVTRGLFGVPLLFVALFVVMMAWWLFLPVVAGPYLMAWLGRKGELRADRKAAELGFAPTLVAVFRQFEMEERQASGAGPEAEQQRTGRGERLLMSHPEPEVRIRELEKYLHPGPAASPAG